MTFVLRVDADRWRRNADQVRDSVRSALETAVPSEVPGDIVAVVKGNGYGLGNARLGHEARRLGLTRVAVGTVYEAAEVASAFDGDVLVLTPFEPADLMAASHWAHLAATEYAPRLVRTISSVPAWTAVASGELGQVRIVLEALSSVGRFGLTSDELLGLLAADQTRDALESGVVRIEGLAVHEPMLQPHADHRAVPGARWHDAVVAPVPPAGATPRVVECLLWGLGWQQAIADLSDRLEGHARIALTEAAALWVSHLDDRELATLRTGLPDIALYPRIGTRLWHGDRGALSARGTVLAVHDVARGQASGYMQRRAPRGGTVVVVGGGTSHGVALEAPSNAMNLHQRGIAAATGLLASAGQALSPFVIGGKHRWFADPPHMHVSLVRVPEGVALPQVGDEVEVTVRFATVNPDRILGLD